MNTEVTFRIVLQAPPAGIDFALQRGRGAQSEAVQVQRSDGGDLCFEFTASSRRVATGSLEAVDFGGPYVQGPAGERFVYVAIGTAAGQHDSPWSRRLKVPLRGISAASVDAAKNARVLETTVPGTARDGSPTCATVKPFAGWKLARRTR
jgi:hypothetical protein